MLQSSFLSRWLVLAVLLGLLTACGDDPAPEIASNSAGSLLLITLDTTRADRLQAYGAHDSETPNLAKLAEEGVVLERAYAVAPVTLPTHATLFSGLDPTVHGVHNNGFPLPEDRAPLLAEILESAGLRTAAFVSAAVLEHHFGLDSGFQTYDDDFSTSGARGARLIAERSAAATIDKAIDWLDRIQPGDSFFLWVHLFEPHAAYAPPAPFAERFRDRPYDGEIAAMDFELGRLLRHGRASDPSVTVMAIGDHGESLGEHGEDTHAMLAYDATLRIPWIIRSPGLPRGRRVDLPVSQIDFLPSALDLLGIEEPQGLETPGKVLGPVLRGESLEPPQERALYAESLVPFLTYGWAPLHSLRRGPWKLIQGGGIELYDVEADPGELQDLSATERRQARALERELAEHLAQAASPSETETLDRETKEKLSSLGYLVGVAGTDAAAEARSERPDPQELIDVHLAFERAAHHFQRHELELAIPELRQVLVRDAENLAALSMLSRSLSERMAHQEALMLAAQAVSLAPESAEVRRALGVVEARAGQLEPALATLEEALDLEPTSLDARLEIALLLFRLSRADEGEEVLREILAETELSSRAQIAFAEHVELESGDLESAERRLRDVLSRDPSQKEGWRLLGRVLQRDRRFEEAIDAYRTGLEHVPGDGLLYAQLGLALAKVGQLQEAESHLRRATDLLRPGSAAVHNALARLLLQKGAWSMAQTEAERAVELDPTLAPAWNYLAAAREEQGDIRGALAAYRRSLEADPDYWHAEFNRALLLRRQGRYEEAAAGYRTVLSKAPGDAKSHFELGLLNLSVFGDREGARRHLQAAIEAEPGHARAAEARRILEQELGG